MSDLLLLLLGFIFLIKGADLLVSGSSDFARKLKISELAIGLTVVAFGTSTAELFVNIFACIKGDTDIALGNVLGSNIFNILFILGISSLIRPLSIKKGTVWKEIPLAFLAAILIGILANDSLIDGNGISSLTRADGFVLLSFFIIFLYYASGILNDISSSDVVTFKKTHGLWNSLSIIMLGFAGLILGSNWVIDASVRIAMRLGISQSLIGLTVISAGTSLPELATSAVAAYKKNSDIAVGNIIGSNIFNIFFILGISSLICPLPLYRHFNRDVLVLVFSSFLIFLFAFLGKKRTIDRWEGMIFIVLYTVYIYFIMKHNCPN